MFEAALMYSQPLPTGMRQSNTKANGVCEWFVRKVSYSFDDEVSSVRFLPASRKVMRPLVRS